MLNYFWYGTGLCLYFRSKNYFTPFTPYVYHKELWSCHIFNTLIFNTLIAIQIVLKNRFLHIFIIPIVIKPKRKSFFQFKLLAKILRQHLF